MSCTVKGRKEIGSKKENKLKLQIIRQQENNDQGFFFEESLKRTTPISAMGK